MRAILHYTTAIVAASLVAACQSDATAPLPPPDPPLTLSVAPTLATIHGGKIVRLSATVRHTDGSSSAPPDVRWISADETIATVENGLVNGLKAGRVQIVATWHDSRGSSVIVVLNPTATKPPPPCIEPSKAGTGITEDASCL